MLATGVQRATYLLWIAENNPSGSREPYLAEYDREMSLLSPKFLYARILVAAHNLPTYDRLSGLSNRFYKLDADIAVASKQFRASRGEGLKALRHLFQEAQLLHKAYLANWPKQLRRLRTSKVIGFPPAKLDTGRFASGHVRVRREDAEPAHTAEPLKRLADRQSSAS